MKTISHFATLFYYDGDQVFEARDSIGGHYIAVKIDELEKHDRYLIAGVEPENIRQFRSGLVDLRSLLVQRTETEWYLGIPGGDYSEPLKIQLQELPLEQSGYLPDPGFLLHDLPAGSETVSAARARNNLVMEITVEPPEAAQAHRIRVETLNGLLFHVQALVKHAYSSALRELPASLRRAIDRSDAHMLDVVVPARAGSFGVLLEASTMPDLLGMNELSRALRRVDELFEKVQYPQEVLTVIRAHPGHLAGAYLRLLQFLVENKTGLRYSWAEPSFAQASNRQVSQGEAAPLVDLLAGVSNLSEVSVILFGALRKADLDNGTWRLSTTEGDFSGKIKPEGPSLRGLKTDSTYRFECLEVIEETKGTGREQRTLYLLEHKPA